jgi:hypothetical protein
MKDGTYRAEPDGMGGIKITTSVHMGQGYWVADDSGVTVEGELTEQGISDALNLMDIVSGEYVGVWTDTETNITYVDRSYHFIRKDVAIDFGNMYNQKAIWDCAMGEEVRL